jgi:hypothetical protein
MTFEPRCKCKRISCNEFDKSSQVKTCCGSCIALKFEPTVSVLHKICWLKQREESFLQFSFFFIFRFFLHFSFFYIFHFFTFFIFFTCDKKLFGEKIETWLIMNAKCRFPV